jgi:hypothetical protein
MAPGLYAHRYLLDFRGIVPGVINLGRVVALGCAAAVATACAGPVHGTDDYRHKLANTAEALESTAQTVILTANLLDRHRVFLRYAADVISQAEDDATSIQQTFDSRQPPSKTTDDLRQKADTTIQDVVSAITDARIGARSGDVGGVNDAASQLRKLIGDLDKLQQVA